MKHLSLITLVIAIVFAVVSTVASAALLNAGFEANTGDGGSADNWTSDAMGTEAWGWHSGDWGMTINSWGDVVSGNTYQTVAVADGTDCDYSIWARNEGSSAGNYYMSLAWYNGATLVDTTSQNIATSADWTEYNLSTVAPTGIDSVQVTFGASGVNAVGMFDDADFEAAAVPEPASLLLLASGLLGLFGISRKKQYL